MLGDERAILSAMTPSSKAAGRHPTHWLAVHLLVVMVALRALIPAGFMPDFGAAQGGSFQLVFCTAAGLHAVTVDARGEPTDPSPVPAARHEHCAFAAAPLGLAESPSALAVVPGEAVVLVHTPTADQRLAVPPRWNWHGARAPPVWIASLIPFTI